MDSKSCTCACMHPDLPILTCSQAPSGATVINARGKYVVPGGIDPHTHLSFPFMGQVSHESFLRYSGVIFSN